MKQKEFRINRIFVILTKSILFIATIVFRIKAKLSPDVKNLKGPYLLLSNHIGTYDPFIVGYYLHQVPNYISSDAIQKDPFIAFMVNKFGVIPIRKNARDTQVIRNMMAVVKRGGAIGLFPEGTRSWTGTTLYIEPNVAKLAKLLKIPVVTAVMKGMHLTDPRWAFRLRRAAIEIEYNLCFTEEELKKASVEEITEKIRKDLFHDEVDFQREHMHEVRSKHRAEYISYALFLCPACNSIGNIESKGNDFECTNCGQKHYVNKYGFFENSKGEESSFDNIRDWFDWQRRHFEKFVTDHYKRKTYAPLFSDENMEVIKEVDNSVEALGSATVFFYINRLVLHFDDGRKMEMPLEDIQTLNPQLKERIEIIYKGQNYRITSKTPGISGLKWEFAANAIWQLTGEEYKQSSYLIQ